MSNMQKPRKSCFLCAAYVPQTYGGKLLQTGACWHLAFFKSGLGRYDEGEGVSVEFRNVRDRLDLETVTARFNDHKYWVDIIDIKNKFRICTQYFSLFALAPQILEFYKDDFTNYHWADPRFLEWANAGYPMEEKNLARFRVFHIIDHDVKELPDDSPLMSPDYKPCILCHHFKNDINEDGSPKPCKGICQEEEIKEGLFSISADVDVKHTYTFLSCEKFLLRRDFCWRQVNDVIPVPQKLLPFVETNPWTVPIEDIQMLCKLPAVTKRTLIDQEVHKGIIGMDLIKLIHDKWNEVDHASFYQKMGLNPVSDFFKKRLVKTTKKAEGLYSRFKHYDESDDIYEK